MGPRDAVILDPPPHLLQCIPLPLACCIILSLLDSYSLEATAAILLGVAGGALPYPSLLAAHTSDTTVSHTSTLQHYRLTSFCFEGLESNGKLLKVLKLSTTSHCTSNAQALAALSVSVGTLHCKAGLVTQPYMSALCCR